MTGPLVPPCPRGGAAVSVREILAALVVLLAYMNDLAAKSER